MLRTYPENALEKIEFTAVQQLLQAKCQMAETKDLVANIRFHTQIGYLDTALRQTKEYLQAMNSADPFPGAYTISVAKPLQLLRIPNAVLSAADLQQLQRLALSINQIQKWFKKQDGLYAKLGLSMEGLQYEPEINAIIAAAIDANGNIRDAASEALGSIRSSLATTRQQQRRSFEQSSRKHARQGYLADIGEGYLNGRRTLAVLREYKRIVKGILHGESEQGKIVFIEPESTIELNNEVVGLEQAEARELHRILQELSARIAPFHSLLSTYAELSIHFDFVQAKALLAKDMQADMPLLSPHPGVHIIKGYHPLLWLHNQRQGKTTQPISIRMDKHQRLLIISGPNAGGKTVSMKTVGLLQMMLQAGLLIPTDPSSEMGIFKQLFIHIGDTQSIENELSTYSAHLKDMKYFLEHANGKTLFFIDELGSGSDPTLGGAFAEAIVEELAQRRAFGIITTHYLNLKVMAGRVPGIFNGAMAFDEAEMEPLYKLEIGKPGSSYTFAIAHRSRLPQEVIARAQALTDEDHFRLDKMLHRAEQLSVQLQRKDEALEQKLLEQGRLKQKYDALIDKETKSQAQATLRLQNKIKETELAYLRDMERKFKQIIVQWKQAEDKGEVIKAAEKVLFKKRQIAQNAKAERKADKKYTPVGKLPEVGDLVKNDTNHQVGTVTEITGKRANVKIGKMIFNVQLAEWTVVRARSLEKKTAREINKEK